MKKHCLNLIFPILIVLLVVLLAFKNYVPGTFLSGWDTLHPEFNFHLYLNRILGVWQEHQGVGAVAAQAHAGELTRIIFPYLLSLILPLSMVRYVFMFLLLGVGGLGIYFLTNYILSISLNKSTKPAAFLASTFYILNLVTLQQFYNPLEMFTVHYATLPWIFLMGIKYLREGKKKNILWFSIITIFSSSIAHTATLFYVYFGLFSLFIVTTILLNRNKGKTKRGMLLIILTVILNLFWLAPNIYYVMSESSTVSNSQVSRTFSTEAFLQSRAFGDTKNLALLKNFPFNWREFDFTKGSFEDQLSPWISHLNQSHIVVMGYVLMGLAIIGVAVALIRKSKYAISLLPLVFVCGIFWINENPPFTGIFAYLRQNIPLFAEALRFPFTKFSIILIFCLSIFLSFSAQFILRIFAKIKLQFIFVILFTLSLVYYMLPAFKGNFVDSFMKVKIPNEYFQTFEWFKKQDPNARVAKFPIQSFWNWVYYDWEYQGAGFTWFGIAQPTLDREFDRWGLYNEDFYFEASNALYSGNSEAFYNVLKKYQVKYLLLDESVINAGGNARILYNKQLKEMVDLSSGFIHESAKFGFITIYETNVDIGDKFIFVPSNYSKINSDMTYAKVDPIFATYGDYVEVGDLSFPFVNLDERGNVKISVTENGLRFENVKTNDEVDLNTSKGIKVDLGVRSGFSEAKNCDLKGKGKVFRDFISEGIMYRAEDGGVSCDYINFPDLKYSQGYVLHITGENLEGRSLKIYLINHNTYRTDLEELLPEGKFDKTYFIYPTILNEEGYTLDFETRSYGRIASENLISKVEFYPVDYGLLSTYKSSSNRQSTDVVKSVLNNIQILDVKKYGTWGYRVEVKGEGLMSLGQGYEKGWIAFETKDIINIKTLKHIKVNSWANGWFIPGRGTYYILFWPQVLEWGGMVLGTTTLLILVLKKNKNTP